MRRKIVNGIVVVLVLTGVALLVYPYAGFRLSGQNQSYVVGEYDDSLEKLTEQQMKEEWERAQAYNCALFAGSYVIYDPFASGSEPMDAEYASLLDIDGNGVMCHIEIPKIGVDLPVFHGVSATTLENGVGHLEGSSLPVGGAGTHAVLTGHTGLNAVKMFTDLAELQTGDEFYIYTLDQILAYRIDSITVVEPQDVGSLEVADGRDYVTLVTCTPYGINSHRLLVRGERADYTPEEIVQRITDTDTVMSRETWLLYAGIALLLLLILMILTVTWRKSKKKRKKEQNEVNVDFSADEG